MRTYRHGRRTEGDAYVYPDPPGGLPRPPDEEPEPATRETGGEEVLDEDADEELVDSADADRLASGDGRAPKAARPL